jgi:predicted PurR-regulated permease PerM
MEKKEKKIAFYSFVFLLIIFLILAIIIIRPLFVSILAGIILAYLFYPFYNFLLKYLKNKSLTAFLVCIIFILVLGLGLWFGAKALSDQAYEFYKNVREYNLVEKVSDLLTKSIIKNEEFANYIGSQIKVGLLGVGRGILAKANEFIANILAFLIQLFVTFFTMFYFLRDGEKIYKEIEEILPFEEKVKQKIRKRTQEVTKGVVYGRVVVGIIQGLVAGVGYYVFGIKHPLLFTVLSIFFAILPFVGAWLVWIPVGINFIFSAGWQIGILHFLYQLIITNQVDNVISPYIVGKTTRMNNVVVLIGMIGGIATFGIVGLIVGPLIFEYLFILLEIYKEKTKGS